MRRQPASRVLTEMIGYLFTKASPSSLPHYFTTDAAAANCLRLPWALKADINSARLSKFHGGNKFPIVSFHSLSFPEAIVAESCVDFYGKFIRECM